MKIVENIKRITMPEDDITRQISKLIRKRKKVMLNVGCGTDYKEGWINIDNNSDENIEKLDLNWDLRNPLPFKDNSVDFIFNEHLIEHLTVEEGQAAIKDMMRTLKPGGVLRIATPDLEECVKLYLNKNWKKTALIKEHDMGFVETPAELLNMNFSWWGHRWLYDWTELDRRLKQAGCTTFKRVKNSASAYLELQNLETRKESKLVVEVVK